MASQDSTRWWVAAEALVALCVVSLPLTLGGALDWSGALLVALAAAALLTWAVGAWKHRRRATWHSFLWVSIGLLGVALVSQVPLPPSVLAVLSPTHAELRDFSLVPLGLERWRPITVDAPSTWRAVARIVALASLAFVTLQLGRLEGPKRRLLGVVAISGVLVAVVGFGHLLAGADTLFGVHHFYGSVPLLSFFGNTNHLSAYLALSGTVALALSLDASSRESAIGWGALALICGAGVFLSFSRGGIGAFVATLAMVGVLMLSRRQGGVRGAVPWLVIGATMLFALSLASEPLLERLATVSTVDRLKQTKIELWPMFWDGASAYSRAGMGLGAFELAFTRFQTSQLDVTFTHPENLILQWVSELGLPLFVVLLAGLGFCAVQLWRQTRGALLEQVLLLSLCGVVLHELFDFALELNALPPAVAVVLGLVAARESSKLPEPRRSMVRRGGLVLAGAISVVGIWAVSIGLPSHRRAEDALAELVKGGGDVAPIRERALALIDRHPSDWVLYALVANHLAVERTPRDALAWVNRVLFLRPKDARAHVAAARALLVLGQPTQALLEFKTAWVIGDESTLDEGLALASKLGSWDRLLVDTPGLLTRLWERTRKLNRPDDGRALLDAAQLLPLSPAVLLEAQVLEVWQSNVRGDLSTVLSRLDALPLESTAQPELIILRARTLTAIGRGPEAITQLDALARKAPQDVDLAMTLADLLAKEGRPAQARAALDRVRPFVTGPRARSALFQTEATLWMQEERWGRALDSLQTAARIEPGLPHLHYRLAECFERMGSLNSALDEIRKGRVLDSPAGAKAQDAWVERLEAAMTQAIMPPGDP